MFTINSQPPVNGIKSSDVKYGWGPSDGYCYQKEYYEFFVPKEVMKLLAEYLEGVSKTISYQAVNIMNDKVQNVPDHGVNAVTWGVFPGREVQ